MNRILVVGPSWVGDMVMAQSLFKVLKKSASGCHITVLAPAWSEPLLARMSEVDSSLVMPIGHGQLGLSKRWRLGRTLRGRFDQAIVLPGSFKSALIPMFAGIKRRTGFVGEQRYGLLNDLRKLDKDRLPYNVQRFVSLGLESGASVHSLDQILPPALKVDTDRCQDVLQQFGLDHGKPIVVLCPGAEFGPAKQWPAAYYAEVAQHQLDSGRSIVIMGSDKDRSVAANITDKVHGCVDLSGRTTLGEAIDLMSLAAHVVTNDSGLMHIGAAVGCHVIAIYGSSSDDFTPPLTQNADKLHLDLPCRPCFQRTCPLGHTNCLNNLMPAQVIEVLERHG